MEDNSVDSIVTDPPYGLSFMGKKWDYNVPSVEMWKEAFRVLKPGGHLLSFAGSRTYHRMAVNIEDAGFRIRDQIMWVYGSGFPKSQSISKNIDKKAGRYVEGEVLPSSRKVKGPLGFNMKGKTSENPQTDEAKQWQGWGSALKPAHEPIVLAQKPFTGTIIENVLEHGTGGLNIDGCRVGQEGGTSRINGSNAGKPRDTLHGGNFGIQDIGKGRFPANFIHDGSDEVVSLFPESTGGHAPKKSKANPFGGVNETERKEIHYAAGSAARFFYCAKAQQSEKGENNNHPTVKPVALMKYLCRLITPPNGVVLDPFMGSGTTGIAANVEGFNFIGIEREEEYIGIARHRISHWIEIEEQKVRVLRAQRSLFEW
jgi:site-specific DNA-methyltransferase (adenine-specific)